MVEAQRRLERMLHAVTFQIEQHNTWQVDAWWPSVRYDVKLVLHVRERWIAAPSRAFDVANDDDEQPRILIGAGIENGATYEGRALLKLSRHSVREEGRVPVGRDFVNKGAFE